MAKDTAIVTMEGE